MRCDAIVVGGGLAGVTAARELEAAGLQTVLLEARDRLGGRTWTSHFWGRAMELGGASIHWSQPHIFAEVTRAGLDVERRTRTDYMVVPGEEGLERHPTSAVAGRIADLYRRCFDGFADVLPRPYDPLFRRELITEIDQWSLQDRLSQLDLSPEDARWLSGYMHNEAGDSLEDRAFTSLLRWYLLCGGSAEGLFSLGDFTIAGGTGKLLSAMLAPSGVTVRLSEPVVSIADTDAGVQIITADGTEYRADVAVVAVPVSMWPSITFTPELSPARRKAADDGVCLPCLTKVWLDVRGSTDRIYAVLPPGAPFLAMRSEWETDEGQCVVAFSVDSSFDPADHAVINDVLRDVLPGSQVIDVKAHAWGDDAWSRGGVDFLRPGQMSKTIEEITQPAGHLAFANAALAKIWTGTLDGAVESGLRAAQVARGLRSGAATAER